MTTKPPRTPQEKKALSYVRDYRNTNNSSDKSIRTLIPQRTAGESRKARRKANHALQIVDRVEEAEVDLLESSLKHDVERVGGWRKWPPVSLADSVDGAHERRESLGMVPAADPNEEGA
jgi:hypothetical protein